MVFIGTRFLYEKRYPKHYLKRQGNMTKPQGLSIDLESNSMIRWVVIYYPYTIETYSPRFTQILGSQPLKKKPRLPPDHTEARKSPVVPENEKARHGCAPRPAWSSCSHGDDR